MYFISFTGDLFCPLIMPNLCLNQQVFLQSTVYIMQKSQCWVGHVHTLDNRSVTPWNRAFQVAKYWVFLTGRLLMSWTHEYKTTKQWNWCISWCISCLCLSLSSSNMARYRQLTNVHRRQIINLKRRNITSGRISIQLDCTVRIVQRVWSRYRNT